jgi:hypothetical protein
MASTGWLAVAFALSCCALGCSSSSSKDMYYGTDAGAGFEAPIREVTPEAAGGTAGGGGEAGGGASGQGGTGGTAGTDGTAGTGGSAGAGGAAGAADAGVDGNGN